MITKNNYENYQELNINEKYYLNSLLTKSYSENTLSFAQEQNKKFQNQFQLLEVVQKVKAQILSQLKLIDTIQSIIKVIY
ncbi:hypothetical protein SCLARK_001181 [Spiroplasma clarkii]|uniref:hypothetical protein n=1 Tax=Spiroplasma clarkii TaxID=2139 RepID=UPI000B57FBCB|nr:hypothetical protein [Spiroplasma clarkii]ARU91739.1 hypothetical protein SCLARK_001181 [Spiroplasma clarkii]